MKKNTKHFLLLTTAAIASIYSYNRIISDISSAKNLLSDGSGTYYNWKFGNIFYNKRGKGNPVLLIHDTNVSSSAFEWYRLVKRLEKDHTVYTLDLLGCGRSDKPALTYTNYMYVQLLTAFAHDVIGKPTDIIATGYSSTFTLLANQFDPDMFQHIILVNPPYPKETAASVSCMDKLRKNIFEFPLLGTFLYNISHTRSNIDLEFKGSYFKKPQSIVTKLEDIYYEAAHSKNSAGKYLYASQIGNYMNVPVEHAIRKLDKPVHIIASQEVKSNMNLAKSYRQLNKNIETHYLNGCKQLPQLEIPEKFLSTVYGIFDH